MKNQYIPTDQAINGTKRIIRGETHDTADIVNEAISQVRELVLDLDAARSSLKWVNPNATDDQVLRYATEKALLVILGSLTGANFEGQLGKWNTSTAESIHSEVNSYLNRRIQGQKANWTKNRRSY